MRRLLASILVAITVCGGARAQEDGLLSGTLQTISDRGTILIGYRVSASPFSFLNQGGQPVGFSIDLCHAIAEDAARLLNRDLLEPGAPGWQTGVRIVYVPVAPDERLPKLLSGAIDLECGSTTANAERGKVIDFSPIFFLAGTKLMVPLVNRRLSIRSYHELAGRTIVVSSGTTNAGVIRQLAPTVTPPINVVEVADLDTAYDMLVAGKADAFASDDILLAGFIATRPDGKRFGITPDYLSFDPYAIGFRKGDLGFSDLVHDSFKNLAVQGGLVRLYNRWLMSRLPNGDSLNVPVSAQLSQMYSALGMPE